MKKMIHVSMMVGDKFSTKNKEVFIEEQNLKEYVLRTDFNEYNLLSFSSIDIWEP